MSDLDFWWLECEKLDVEGLSVDEKLVEVLDLKPRGLWFGLRWVKKLLPASGSPL